MKYYLTLFLIINLNLFSEEISITSKVIDINLSSISNANIVCGDHGTTTNYNGFFKIKCNDNDSLHITHISYKDYKTKAAFIKEETILNNSNIIVDKVVVNGGINNTVKTSNVEIIKDKLILNSSNYHFEDIINSTPTLNYASGTSRPRYFQIRGIGELSQFSGEGPPHFYISTIIDNIDFSGIGGVGILDDINQIEIFKGPQSTFYGPNAMGGVINFTSNKPTSANEYIYSINIGKNNEYKGRITVNLPLTKKLYFRGTLSNYKTDGFIYNDFNMTDDSNGKDERLLKINFLRKTNKNKTVNYFLYLIDMKNKYNQWSPDNNGYTTYTDFQGYDTQKTTALSINKTIKLENGVLNSISSYSDNKMKYSYDGDWANDVYWENAPYNWPDDYPYSFPDVTNRNKRQKSKEIRYSNEDITLGFYISEIQETDIRKGWIFAGYDYLNSKFTINNSSIYLQIIDNTNSKTNINTTIRFDNYKTKNLLSYSKYNWTTDEDDVYDNIKSTIKDNLVGLNLAVNHKINNVSNLNFNIANGYKTAGINQSPNFSEHKYYSAEKALNLELGYQLNLPTYTVSLSAFYIKRKNPQMRTFIQLNIDDPTSFDYGTINGIAGYSKGIEMNITKNHKNLIIKNSFSILDTYINEINIEPFSNNPDGGSIICGGRDNAHSPRLKHNITLSFKLNRWIKGLAYSIERNFTDEFYFDDQNDHIANSRIIINTNLVYKHKDKINFNFWIKNLTNEIYETRGYTFALKPGIDGNEPEIEDYQSFGDKQKIGISIEFLK